MNHLLRRIAVLAALVVAAVAVAAPSGLAVPVLPDTGERYVMPKKVTKKTRRVNQPLSRCRDQRHVRIIGCPVPW